MRRPYNGSYPVTRPYGVYDPAYSNYPGSVHPGTDYGTPENHPMIAAISGTVTVYARGNTATGRGNEVVITNGSTQVKYCHLNRIDVATGSKVTEGQQVGLCGWTGYVLPKSPAGSHLHFETLINGVYKNPETQYNSTSIGGKIMDTDAKVAAQYNILRGNTGTAAERAAWIGSTYEKFNATAIPEINARQANLTNLQKQVASQNVSIATLNTKVTALTNQVNTLTAQVKTLTATVVAKDKEIADLKAQVATGGNGEDTQLLNSFGEALRKLIVRLGLKG